MSTHRARDLVKAGPVDVQGRRGGVRPTRGYSLLELDRAGISIAMAGEMSLPIDPERKTGIGANVMRLRELMMS